MKAHTLYVPELRNKTRWMGYNNMAVKYEKIYDAMEKTGGYRHIGEDDTLDIEVDGE